MKTLTGLALLIVITGTFAACKKNGGNGSTCRITTVTYKQADGTVTSETRILYNSDGRISKITFNGGSSNIYTYSGNTTTITGLDPAGSVTNKSIITLNTLGLATIVRREFNASGSLWDSAKYEYDGPLLTKSTQIFSNSGSPSITTYTWSNQNMISSVNGATTRTYEYYTDKLWKKGDYFDLCTVSTGYEIYRTKNLLKNNSYNTFTYEFRPGGEIARIVYTNTGSTIPTGFTEYGYECSPD